MQAGQGEVLFSADHQLRCDCSRSGPVCDCCRSVRGSGSVRDQDGELLQASSHLLCREDELLLGSRELQRRCCSGSRWWGRQGSSSAAEGRSCSGPEGLVATLPG